MALQTENQISLNEIHVEAGGTSGTLASLNDTDIRALIDSTAGTEIDFADFYGASAVSYNTTHTITASGNSFAFYGRGYWDFDVNGHGMDRGSISSSNAIGSTGFVIGAFFYYENPTSVYLQLIIGRTTNWSSNPLSTIKIKTGNSAIDLFTSDLDYEESGENAENDSSYFTGTYALDLSTLTSAQKTAIENAMDSTTFEIEVT